MKFVRLIFILIPVILIAQQETDKYKYLEENADWMVPSEIGTILEIRGDSINYEEAWMKIIPNKTVITDKSGKVIGIENLQAPCKVEIGFFGKGRHQYVKSIKLLKQLQYTADGYIVGDKTITE
ncbi:MAG: hypothetical protein ABIL07_02500 [candidate division WOR-3 bacterium]